MLVHSEEKNAFFPLILKTWEKSGSERKMKRAECVQADIWEGPWVFLFLKDKLHSTGSSQTTGLLLAASRGKPGSEDCCEMSSGSAQLLGRFEGGYLPDNLVIVSLTTNASFLTSCCPSKHKPRKSLRTGRVIVTGPLHFFPFVILGKG